MKTFAFILFLAICTLNVQAQNETQTIASGLSISSKIVMDSDAIYWTEDDGTVPYYEDATTGVVRKVQKNGGTITTLASGLNHPVAILLDATNVYFIERGSWPNANGTLKKITKNGDYTTIIATGLDYPQGPTAMNSTHIYWQEPTSTIKKINITGGDVITFYNGTPIWSLGYLALDTVEIFWSEPNSDASTHDLKKMSLNGGEVTVLATQLSSAGANIVLDSANVYWSDQAVPPYGYPVTGDGEVKKVPRNGGVPTPLATGLNAPSGIILDSFNGYLYWTDGGTWTSGVYDTNSGSLKKISIDGGITTTITTGLNGPGNLQLDENNIYWPENPGSGLGSIKRMSRGENILSINPKIILVKDVPNDQGGKISLFWNATYYDTNTTLLSYYSIWRAIPQLSVQKSKIIPMSTLYRNFNGTAYRVTSINGTTYFWEWITNQPAHKFTEYSYTAATLYDSMSNTDGKHYFLVSAHTNNPNVFYDSNVDSGYSVDNLAPLAPKYFAGSFIASMDRLNWSPNSETDLKEYVIYRGTSPADQTLFTTTRDTFYINNNPRPGNSYWWIRARDIHDNLSDYSSLVITDIKETGMIPTTYSLSQNYPNPFNPSTTIKYALPQASHVSLSVYNTLGQRIALLVDEMQEAGYHEVNFDASGLTSGVYFYHIQAGEQNSWKAYTETKKLLLMK
ncbi:MAG: T9SS type A sorting domain-containing protein [Ignavibacteriales bacterium]|nr:T9SS type A sorting domain-containing protein [Ignavibacteriales bacterium]